MKRKFLHIAMFRAMDCLFDEMKNPPEILDVFLTDANPYIWADHTTADPAVQADFDRSMDRQNIGAQVDEATAYNAVKIFLAEQNLQFAEWFEDVSRDKQHPFFVELFEDISPDEWKELCALVTEEEEARSSAAHTT